MSTYFVKGHPPMNESGFSSIIQWVNASTNNLFGLFTLITWFIISFMALKQFTDTKEALTASAFTTTIISFLLHLLSAEMVPVHWITICIFMTAICFISLMRA